MAHTEDENGFILIKDNPISKSGVFQYLGQNISPDLEPDKIYDVWRPEQELNNSETIESFKLAPWIPYHEMLGENYTDAEKVGVQGVTGESVYFRDGTLYSNLKLFGSNLKQSIKEGLKELSCGFGCLWTIIDGVTPNGEAYQVIQSRIRGNHLASVPNGRMGNDVAVAMDRATFALDHLNFENNPSGEKMTKEELKAAMDAAMIPFKTAMDEMSEKIGAVEKKAEDMEEAEKKKAEDMEAEEKKKAEDEEKDKKENPFAKKDDKAMDAAVLALTETVTALGDEIKSIKSNAVDANSVMKALSEKNELANKASVIVGAFDHADMDKQAVAKYALEKMGVSCDAGVEVATLSGYLAARQQPNFVVDSNAQDSSDNSYLKALGL